MRWIVRENETCLCQGLKFEDLPDNLPSNIHFLRSNNAYSICCENIAGVFPCKNGNEIIIEPKYKNIKPSALISYIDDITGITVNKEHIVVGEDAIDLHDISNLFVQSLLDISSKNRKFNRELKEDNIKTIRGKVNWVKTISQYNRGKINDVVSNIVFSNYDIVENALIAAAAFKVKHFYSSNSKEYIILLPWIKQAMKFNHSYSELNRLQLQLNDSSLSGSHAYYYNAIMLAKIILGFNNGKKIVEDNNMLLFNMPNLYESFIRKGFQKIGGKFGYTVQKGFSPRSFLFCDGLCEMIPDIVIYDGIKVKGILDVKYKTPDSKDFYQIFSYMHYTNVSDAYIITPSYVDNTNIVTFDNLRIHFIVINSSHPADLELKVEKIMREAF